MKPLSNAQIATLDKLARSGGLMVELPSGVLYQISLFKQVGKHHEVMLLRPEGNSPALFPLRYVARFYRIARIDPD